MDSPYKLLDPAVVYYKLFSRRLFLIHKGNTVFTTLPRSFPPPVIPADHDQLFPHGYRPLTPHADLTDCQSRIFLRVFDHRRKTSQISNPLMHTFVSSPVTYIQICFQTAFQESTDNYLNVPDLLQESPAPSRRPDCISKALTGENTPFFLQLLRLQFAHKRIFSRVIYREMGIKTGITSCFGAQVPDSKL